MRLAWSATGEDLAYFQLLRRSPPGDWKPAGRAEGAEHTFLDPTARPGSYVYAVQAVGLSGLSSPMTTSSPIRVG